MSEVDGAAAREGYVKRNKNDGRDAEDYARQ